MLSKKNQYSILANPEKKNIYIHKFEHELLPGTMLSLWLFVIHSLTMVYIELTDRIQCYLFLRRTVF